MKNRKSLLKLLEVQDNKKMQILKSNNYINSLIKSMKIFNKKETKSKIKKRKS